jgi:hypothetical protein
VPPRELTDEESGQLSSILNSYFPEQVWAIVIHDQNGETQVMSNVPNTDFVLALLEEGKRRVKDGPSGFDVPDAKKDG